MEELYNKIDNLKNALDNDECIKNLKKLNKEVFQDEKLISLIEKYNYNKDERIQTEIINNELYRKYKQQETELNLLIWEINSRLKEIHKKDKCGL